MFKIQIFQILEKRKGGKRKEKMTTAAFSSISFESELAKRFKKLSRERNESHSQTLNYLMVGLLFAEEQIKKYQDDIKAGKVYL